MKDVEREIIDTLTEQPLEFKLDGRRYSLQHATLGRSLVAAKIADAMELTDNATASDLLRCVTRHRDRCAEYVALHTFRRREDIMSDSTIGQRARQFLRADDATLAELVTACMLANGETRANEIISKTDIGRDHERMNEVCKAKEKGNSYTFGARTIYGQLIDVACERYGWSLDYVLWEISLANLRLLLADHVENVYLSDKEQKRCHLSNDREIIRGDDPRNADRIKKMLNN